MLFFLNLLLERSLGLAVILSPFSVGPRYNKTPRKSSFKFEKWCFARSDFPEIIRKLGIVTVIVPTL